QRVGFRGPILIGGATTSRLHTALRLAPNYEGLVEHVADASLVVNVCNSLLDDDKKAGYVAAAKEKQESLRQNYGKEKSIASYEESLRSKPVLDWASYVPPKPEFTGTKVFDRLTIDEIVPYIDWSPFFWAWEFKGTYPKIFSHEKYGSEAKKLFGDGQAYLKQV